MSQAPKKLAELDSVRGIMAAWVYVSHILFFGGKHGHHLKDILSQGGLAVFVFVILSGFAITTSLKGSNSRYRDFIARRFFRLYPAFAISLVLGVLTSHLYSSVVINLPWIDNSDSDRIMLRLASEETNRIWHLLAHITMLHGMIPDKILFGSSLAFCGPLWSLSLEWQFYLFAPAIIAVLISPTRNWVGLAIIILVATLGPRLFVSYFDQVPSFLPQLLGLFIVGILSAIWLPKLAGNDNALIAIAVAIIGVVGLSGRIDLLIPIAIWISTLLVASLSSTNFIGWIRSTLCQPFLVKFGERSYGFYVLHMPLLLVSAEGLHLIGLDRSPPAFMALLFVTTFPLTTLLCWLMFDHVETPVNRWAKRRFGGVKLARVSSFGPNPS